MVLSLAVFLELAWRDELRDQIGVRVIFNKRVSKHRESCTKSFQNLLRVEQLERGQGTGVITS